MVCSPNCFLARLDSVFLRNLFFSWERTFFWCFLFDATLSGKNTKIKTLKEYQKYLINVAVLDWALSMSSIAFCCISIACLNSESTTWSSNILLAVSFFHDEIFKNLFKLIKKRRKLPRFSVPSMQVNFQSFYVLLLLCLGWHWLQWELGVSLSFLNFAFQVCKLIIIRCQTWLK